MPVVSSACTRRRCKRGDKVSTWVNGQLAATHEGGHTPFSADITSLLDPSGRQKVTVMVVDDPHDLTKPRGKQDWQKEPHSIWYPRTTGIWQTVWLERVSRAHVSSIRWRCNPPNRRCGRTPSRA